MGGFEMLTVETQKVCSRCGGLKSLDDFTIDKRCIGGHAGICRQCKNLFYRRKYRENPQKYIEQNKIWKGKHLKLTKKYNKEYREEHKEHIKKLHRNYYRLNRERLIAKSKEYIKEHKDGIRVKMKIYRDSHKKKISKYNKWYREQKKLGKRGII